jgi:hypothetical protein
MDIPTRKPEVAASFNFWDDIERVALLKPDPATVEMATLVRSLGSRFGWKVERPKTLSPT